MIYHVKPREEKTQVSLMQILMGIDQKKNDIPNTTTVRKVNDTYVGERFDLRGFVEALKAFNASTEALRTEKRWDLYEHFKLPKKSGGWRPIDAPKPQLGAALTTLRALIEGAIGERFEDVLLREVFPSFEVGDRSRDAQNLIVSARRQSVLVHSAFEHLRACVVESRPAFEMLTTHLRVRRDRFVRVASRLDVARALNLNAHFGAGGLRGR